MSSIKLFKADQQYIQRLIQFFVLPVMFILVFIIVNTFLTTIALGKEEKLIRVGVYENNPKIYTDSNGDITGFWPDLIEYIADKENWNILSEI